MERACKQVERHVAVAGDWHGDTAWARDVLHRLHKKGIHTLLHVGDFGVWPGQWAAKYMRKVEKWCQQYDITILVTPGNHEDWDRLNTKKAKDRGDGWGAVKWLAPHVGVLPRGYRVDLVTPTGVTRSMVSLGGAPSVDFEDRTEGQSWWRDEVITPEDVEVVKAGGVADIMVAHDSPGTPWATAKVQHVLDHNPGGFSEAGRAYAAVGTALMTEAFEAVQPRLFLHGHFHEDDVRDWTDTTTGRDGQVVALSDEWSHGNVKIVDLDTLHVVKVPRGDQQPLGVPSPAAVKVLERRINDNYDWS